MLLRSTSEVASSISVSEVPEPVVAPPKPPVKLPVRGPVQIQASVVYIAFVVYAISAEFLGWAPFIRFYNAFPYFAMCWFIIEFSRLLLAVRRDSVVPYYLSLIPFVLLVLISREAHMTVASFYFNSITSTFMQTGNPKLKYHLPAYLVLYLGLYAGLVGAMQFFYTDTTGDSALRGRALDPPINWGEEGTFILVLALLGGVYILCERFLRGFTEAQLKQAAAIHQMKSMNEKLVHELDKLEGNVKVVDLESPLTKAMNSLRSLQQTPGLEESYVARFESILKVLSSDDLFKPMALTQGHMSEELQSYMASVLDHKPTSNVQARSNIRVPSTLVEEGEFRLEHAPGVNIDMARLAREVDEINFDVFGLAQQTRGRPLLYMGMVLVRKHNLVTQFKLDERRLYKFLSIIEEGYIAKNEYHNSLHGADVAQTLMYLVTRCGIKDRVPALDILACIIGGCAHDFEHPGVNNNFLIQTTHEYAVRYNDTSVLEMHHCAAAFRVLMRDDCYFLGHLSPSDYRDFRQTVVKMILATDMARHFEIIGQFTARATGTPLNLADRKDRLAVLEVCIKCADISNPVKDIALCKRWSELIMTEMFHQGDLERNHGLSVSPFMDSSTTKLPKVQTGFIDFFVAPLYKAAAQFKELDVHRHLEQLARNREYWDGLVKVDEARAAA